MPRPSAQTVSNASSVLTNKSIEISNKPSVSYQADGYILYSSMRHIYLLDCSMKRTMYAEFVRVRNAYTEDQTNLDLKAQTLIAALEVSGSVKGELVDKKLVYFNGAKKLEDSFKFKHYFNSFTHYAQHLITAFEGINCQMTVNGKIAPNREKMENAIYQLLRAIALDPASQIYKKALIGLLASFSAILANMKQEKDADQDACNSMQAFFKQVEDELNGKGKEPLDPFKDEFIANPNLFKQLSTAPASLLKKFLHLKDKTVFSVKYELGSRVIFSSDEKLSTQELDQVLASAAKNPFLNVISYMNRNNLQFTPILSKEEAIKLRDFLIANPKLTIQFNSLDNFKIIVSAFGDLELPKNFLMFYDPIVNGKTYYHIAINPNVQKEQQK